jgi:hypothetical protein
MALREGYSLINSEFGDFLFASIGEEGNGMSLSVISALTRLDIDPWREAARLSQLSREAAAQILAPMIARLPVGHWALADAPEIAARLVAFLPRHDGANRASAISTGAAGKRKHRANGLIYATLVAATLLSVVLQHQASTRNDPGPMETPGTDSHR